MLGTAGHSDSVFGRRRPGNDAVYLVCDNPDELYERALQEGAEVARELADEPQGGRGFTVLDPEGNIWAFGTYRGEEPPSGEGTP